MKEIETGMKKTDKFSCVHRDGNVWLGNVHQHSVRPDPDAPAQAGRDWLQDPDGWPVRLRDGRQLFRRDRRVVWIRRGVVERSGGRVRALHDRLPGPAGQTSSPVLFGQVRRLPSQPQDPCAIPDLILRQSFLNLKLLHFCGGSVKIIRLFSVPPYKYDKGKGNGASANGFGIYRVEILADNRQVPLVINEIEYIFMKVDRAYQDFS